MTFIILDTQVFFKTFSSFCMSRLFPGFVILNNFTRTSTYILHPHAFISTRRIPKFGNAGSKDIHVQYFNRYSQITFCFDFYDDLDTWMLS